jgi:hypothetical protein
LAPLATITIRLRDFDVSEDTLLAIGRSTDEFANALALDIFGPGILIDVDLREGTLRAKIRASAPALFGGFMLVANSIQFQEGLVDLYTKAEKFGSAVSSMFLDKVKPSPHQLQKIEYRNETPQRILRLFETLESLNVRVKEGTISHKDLRTELQKARQEFDRICREVTPGEARKISESLRFESLPPPEKWPRPAKAERPIEFRERAKTSAQETLIPSRPRLRYHNKFAATPGGPPDGAVSVRK